MSEGQLVFDATMQKQTSMQSILDNIFRRGLLRLSPGIYEAIVLTAATVVSRRVARNSQRGAVLKVGERSPQLPEANGGLGAKLSAYGGWGSWDKAPSRRRHGGLVAEPPAPKNFAFFAKTT